MQRRRELMAMNVGKDYLNNVVWVLEKYISGNGNIDTSIQLKYTDTIIQLEPGNYELKGQSGSNNSVYYRIHEYDQNGAWVKQITNRIYNAYQDVSMQFVAPTLPNGIRLSVEIGFTGTLKRI